MQKLDHSQHQENVGESVDALRNTFVKTGDLVILVNLAILEIGVSGT
jgi:hypothetical protein